MNYIYDIYLNLNKIAYDFFDWNKNDKLIHIKKIPLFKINKEDVHNLINYNIKTDSEFLNSVHNKAEIWNVEKKIEYCALFSDDNTIVAIEFNETGYSTKKSFLFIEEELDILETVARFKEKKINYKILNKCETLLKTRKEIKEEDFINKELKNIDKNRLNYICFECFGKHINNKNEIIKEIKKLPKNSKTYEKFQDILKLTSTKK